MIKKSKTPLILSFSNKNLPLIKPLNPKKNLTNFYVIISKILGNKASFHGFPDKELFY